ncbi:MAG TPA: hypothetical protein VI248_19145 [Kineosporiaceae bacterium]
MVVVLTVDQQRSRQGPDLVDAALQRLERYPTTRRFERTAGDEFQGLLEDHTAVVDTILDLVREGRWSIGIGIGDVERPLPASTRAGRGPAFLLAREAVAAAKRSPQHLAVRAVDQVAGDDAAALLEVLAALLRSRTPQAWQAIDLVEPGHPQTEAAAKLGISRQAVGQRLAAGHWREERLARPALRRLFERADTLSVAQRLTGADRTPEHIGP